LADIATAKISAVIDKNVEYILSFDQPVSEAIYQAGRSNMLGTLSEMIEFGSPEEKEAAEDALDYLNNQGGFVNFAAACDYLAAAMKNRVGGTYYDEDRTVFDTTSLWQGGYTPIVPPSIFEVGGSTIDPILRLRDPLYIVENIGSPGELLENPNNWVESIGIGWEWTATTNFRMSGEVNYDFAEEEAHVENDVIRTDLKLEFFNHRDAKFEIAPFFEVGGNKDLGDVDGGVMIQINIVN